MIKKYPAEHPESTGSWVFFTDKGRILLIRLLQTVHDSKANIFKLKSNRKCTLETGSRLFSTQKTKKFTKRQAVHWNIVFFYSNDENLTVSELDVIDISFFSC